ncbi:MAG: hypothetical protein K2X48_19200 [Chitinophagaceae bacterium]|nr:hypothetical protein [Chitinophagaceae bacterium]
MKPVKNYLSLFTKRVCGLGLLLGLHACNKPTEDFISLKPEELLPMVKGKYITYRVDSLVSTGPAQVTRYYRVRYQVDSLGKDNLNRPMWIVNRFQTDSGGIGPWIQSGQMQVVIEDKRAEVIENNIRVIKIQLPVREGFTWRGNAFVPDKPYAQYGTSLGLGEWDFTYAAVDKTEKIGNATLSNVTTITHVSDSTGIPVVGVDKYASMLKSFEKYAKGTGLVYREHYVWEFQTNDKQFKGFGIKMWMIDRN